MRIAVHDLSGHPFQVQLSRWLAGDGHAVLHAFSSEILTPQGALAPRTTDPASLTIRAISIGGEYAKYDFLKRIRQELRYARRLCRELALFRPTVILSGNASPIIQAYVLRWARRRDIRFVFWVQDIYAFAFAHVVGRKLPVIGGVLAAGFRRLEFDTIGRSDAVVVISEDFRSIFREHTVRDRYVTTIENWAPSEDMRLGHKDNHWSRTLGIADKFVFLYSGTLGLKHNPSLLSALAESFRDDPLVRVVVVSTGIGRDWLEREKQAKGLSNLILCDFVPFESLPDCLASGDVQIAILEPFANVLSVPSKTLTYIASERPILGAMPRVNLAARIIEHNGIGRVAEPGDVDGFLAAARKLRHDSTERDNASNAARCYKERNFDIQKIGTRFLEVLRSTR